MFPTQYVYFEKKIHFKLFDQRYHHHIHFLNSHFLPPLFWKTAQLDHWTA